MNGMGYTEETDSDGDPVKYTVSDGNARAVEKEITKIITDSAYEDMDKDEQIVDELKISKFNGKKAKVALLGWVGERNVNLYNCGYGTEKVEIYKLKEKTDYDFSEGSIAGTPVSVLELKGDNLIYQPLLKECNTDWSGNVETVTKEYPYYDPEYKYDDLGALGYKWAFRMSPVENSKKFRKGIYHSDNIGFVYEAD